jgi:hypothetical protein
MFAEIDRLLAHQRREELAERIASGRLQRKLRAVRRPFWSPRNARTVIAGPAGGGLRPGGI